MIHFPDLRARRLTIRLKELTIGDALAIAARPVHLEQANTTAFLRAACINPESDPVQWRVGERVLAVAHYLACVMQDPDYPVGEGRYSDYLVSEDTAVPETIEVGDLVEERWFMRHLSGQLAESIERLELEALNGRGRWLIGCMAAQLFRKGEQDPTTLTEGERDEWLQARVSEFVSLPESEFEAMLLGFHKGREQLVHLFRFDVDEGGLICQPTRRDAGLPPARFSVRSNLCAWARAMAQQPD